MPKQVLWLTVIVLALFPAIALANAGTSLMWVCALHLVIGNAVIGLAEGLILALLYKQSAVRCIAVMVVANYFSAWVGVKFLISMIAEGLTFDLYNAWRWLWYMVAASYAITLVLEWPFVALCLRKSDSWFRKSIWGLLITQSASYFVLFGWYWEACDASLYTDMTVVEPSEISFPKDAMLYYIAEQDGNVYVRDLGRGETKECTSFRPSMPESLRYEFYPGGRVPRFRSDNSGWQFDFYSASGSWLVSSLSGKNTREGRSLDVSLETPFLAWTIDCPKQLPGGQVVFQLGANQICVIDPDERKIALIAKGHWPVVTMADRQQ